MKIFLTLSLICLSVFIAISAEPPSASAATACPSGQVRNFILKGKCVPVTAQKAGLKLFTTKACTACHSKLGGGTSCTADLGPGSCSYKKIAQSLKASLPAKSKSVPPSALINLFTAYASTYMPGITAPTSAEAKKLISYLSTIKQ